MRGTPRLAIVALAIGLTIAALQSGKHRVLGDPARGMPAQGCATLTMPPARATAPIRLHTSGSTVPIIEDRLTCQVQIPSSTSPVWCANHRPPVPSSQVAI